MNEKRNLTDTPPSDGRHSRTEMLIGKEAAERIRRAKICIFGIGGVGGYAAEALARCGVGRLCLIDPDRVSLSNINRQIIATHKTVGMLKTEAFRQRIGEISPETEVEERNLFYTAECAEDFNPADFDYVLDCIDHVSGKIEIIKRCVTAGVPVISAMGAGNKLDPTRFRVSDISKTRDDPLARAVRTGLRRLGINHTKVVFSDEPPYKAHTDAPCPASISFVPSVMGLIMAGEVIRDLAGISLK